MSGSSSESSSQVRGLPEEGLPDGRRLRDEIWDAVETLAHRIEMLGDRRLTADDGIFVLDLTEPGPASITIDLTNQERVERVLAEDQVEPYLRYVAHVLRSVALRATEPLLPEPHRLEILVELVETVPVGGAHGGAPADVSSTAHRRSMTSTMEDDAQVHRDIADVRAQFMAGEISIDHYLEAMQAHRASEEEIVEEVVTGLARYADDLRAVKS